LFSEHEQEHSRRVWSANRMRDAGRHPDDCPRRGGELLPIDRQRQRAFEHDDQGVKGRRVLGECLARIEGEQRQIASCRAGKYAARDPLLGRRHERV